MIKHSFHFIFTILILLSFCSFVGFVCLICCKRLVYDVWCILVLIVMNWIELNSYWVLVIEMHMYMYMYMYMVWTSFCWVVHLDDCTLVLNPRNERCDGRYERFNSEWIWWGAIDTTGIVVWEITKNDKDTATRTIWKFLSSVWWS